MQDNRRRPLSIELLESRRLLTAITVNGSSGADEIHVSFSDNGSTILVDVNGSGQSYPDFLYDGVSVAAGNGNDRIYIDSTGANPVTVNGSGGNDETHLGNATQTLDSVSAGVTILSSTGTDGLYLADDAASFADTYTVNNSRVTRSFFGGVSYSGLTFVKLASGDGADVFNVTNTNGTPLTIDGQAGADILNLNAGAGDVIFETNQDFADVETDIGGNLTLTGTAGLLITQNQSNFEGNVRLDRGFIVERKNNLVSGGLGYWRGRLINGATNTTPSLASSYAASSAVGDAIGYGYAEQLPFTTLGGFPLLTGDLVMRYTLKGDADLDQDVDFNDLLALAQNYGGTSREWVQGDFDLSRTVGFDDLLALSQNYGTTAPAIRLDVKTPARRIATGLLS